MLNAALYPNAAVRIAKSSFGRDASLIEVFNLRSCYRLTKIIRSVIAGGLTGNALELAVKGSFAVKSAFVADLNAAFVSFYEKLSRSIHAQASQK